MSTVRFQPADRLRGEVVAPPDKSISHRAALLGAMTAEPVRIQNYLTAADTLSTVDAMRRVGALVEVHDDREVVVRGVGLREAREVTNAIDVGNAGTLMRLLPGWLAAQPGRSWIIDGDESIRRRPVDRIIEPLARMGAHIEAREGRFAPFQIHGMRLHSVAYDLPIASAQVKSCILLAALLADGATTVHEPMPSRDHTERMLAAAGVRLHRNGHRITVPNSDELEFAGLRVPGDPSSAAFAIAAGLVVPGSRLVVKDVGANWTRNGFVRIAERMGAVVLGDFEPPLGDEIPHTEPVTEVDVTAGPLVGTVVEADEVPLAIDELPLVALLGCFAEGETIVRGAEELRVKESDRITAVVDGLSGLGAAIEATPDGFVVTGTGGLRGGRIDAAGDHRMAMMGAIAGIASTEGVEVEGMDAAAVSYPGFTDDLDRLS